MKIYYEETYAGYYEAESEKVLFEALCEGKAKGLDECVNSVITELRDNENPDFQIMEAKIEAMGEDEKKFYLWYLLRHYYKKRLYREKEKQEGNLAYLDYINTLARVVEEIDTLLCHEIW